MLKHYLTIGLNISFGVLFNSCKDVAYVSTSDFYFVNATNYVVTYETGLEKFNVPPKSTTRFTDRKQSFGGGVSRATPPPMLDNPVLVASGDGVITIRFNNAKCLIDEKITNLNSVLDIKNYVVEKTEDTKYGITYKFTYTFTEADYNRAVTCP